MTTNTSRTFQKAYPVCLRVEMEDLTVQRFSLARLLVGFCIFFLFLFMGQSTSFAWDNLDQLPVELKIYGLSMADITNEQKAALLETMESLNKNCEAAKAKYGAGSNQYGAALPGIIAQYEKDFKAILAWPNGKDPNKQQEEPQKPKPVPGQPANIDDIAKKVENAKSCCPHCPYDNDKLLEKLKLTAVQKKKVDELRKQRQKTLAASIKTASKKKNTFRTRRTLYGILRYTVALYNYRIRYSFTPIQIDIFDKEGTEWKPPTFEELTQGQKPETFLIGNEDEVNRDPEKRLTRTNFYKYPEFKSMLKIDDEQEMILTGLDSEAQGIFKAAAARFDELAGEEAQDIWKDCNEQLEKIQKEIRTSFERHQRDSYDTLSLLLIDALDFPSQNIDSFDLHRRNSAKELTALKAIFHVYAKNNQEAIFDPGGVSISKYTSMQKEFLDKVNEVLPSNLLTLWNDAKRKNSKIYEVVKKYKAQ